MPLAQDRDGDGLPDVWELRTDLDPGHAGAHEDPDGDGLTNAQEYAGGTHPRGFYTCYFAEGATGSFFSTELALVNPDSTQEAHLLVSLLGEQGERVHLFRPLAPMSRAVVDAASGRRRAGRTPTLTRGAAPAARLAPRQAHRRPG